MFKTSFRFRHTQTLNSNVMINDHASTRWSIVSDTSSRFFSKRQRRRHSRILKTHEKYESDVRNTENYDGPARINDVAYTKTNKVYTDFWFPPWNTGFHVTDFGLLVITKSAHSTTWVSDGFGTRNAFRKDLSKNDDIRVNAVERG